MPFITDIPIATFDTFVAQQGLKSFAADQIISWLYKKNVMSFDNMTNISKYARDALSREYDIVSLSISNIAVSTDLSKKYIFETHDGCFIESVWIPMDDTHHTICLSTQIGCQMGCAFCRTAQMPFERDLSLGEILDQVRLIAYDNSQMPSNIVFMGMGEPMNNLSNLSDAISILQDGRAFGLSKRRITVSTSGILDKLDIFAKMHDVKIAISLNAATDNIRSQIMPINKRYSIADIVKFAKHYNTYSKHRITFEYVLIQGINDTDSEMKQLVELLSMFPCKINLIPFNGFDTSEYKRPFKKTVDAWSKKLYQAGIQTNIRISRGQDIMASCGQLASKKNRGD